MTDVAGEAAQIRDLIEHWARAVHGGDLGAVPARHAGDIVLFDVPRRKDDSRWVVTHEHHSFAIT